MIDSTSNRTINEGGILEVVDGLLTKDDYTVEVSPGAVTDYLPSAALNPDMLVIEDILYDANKLNPQAYIDGRTAIAMWPNKGSVWRASDRRY